MSDRKKKELENLEMIKEIECKELLRGSTPTFAKLYAKGVALGLENGCGYPISHNYAIGYMIGYIEVYFKGFSENDCVTPLEQFLDAHPNKIFMISEYMIEWLMYYKIYENIINPELNVKGIPLTNGIPAENISDREKRMRIFLTSIDDPDYREWLCEELKIFSESKIYYKAVRDLSGLTDLLDYKMPLKIVCNIIKYEYLTLEQLADVSGYNICELKNIKNFMLKRKCRNVFE
ncbi:MAG: hypothetical protein J6K26_08015 [Lachnospiraceae bacterium]|nr:hypothetical protein [Lachnospiraceae bacterium]